MLGNFVFIFVVCWFFFFKIDFFKKFLQKYYQSVKQFGSRSGPTECRSWSGSKLFAKVISIGQKLQLARKELNVAALNNLGYITRKGETQTSQLSYTDLITIWNLGLNKDSYSLWTIKYKGAGQSAWVCRLIYTYVVHVWQKPFLLSCFIPLQLIIH